MSLRVVLRLVTPVLLVCLAEVTFFASPGPKDLLTPVTIACLVLAGYFGMRANILIVGDVGLADAILWFWRQGNLTLEGMSEDAAREYKMGLWFMLGAVVLSLLEVARMFRKH